MQIPINPASIFVYKLAYEDVLNFVLSLVLLLVGAFGYWIICTIGYGLGDGTVYGVVCDTVYKINI